MKKDLHLATKHRLEEWESKGISIAQLVDNEIAMEAFDKICERSIIAEDYAEVYEEKCKIGEIMKGLKLNLEIIKLLDKPYTSEEMDKICDKLLGKEPVEFSSNDSENDSSFQHKEPCNAMNIFGTTPTKLFSIYKR